MKAIITFYNANQCSKIEQNVAYFDVGKVEIHTEDCYGNTKFIYFPFSFFTFFFFTF